MNEVTCECGNDTFKLQIDREYEVVIYQCTKCGYIETSWKPTEDDK
jgi:Zn ribbon nucleic-acid-binding protein